jgi:hypothetical protein
MGKYSSVVANLPRLAGEPGFQAKVEEAKTQIFNRAPGDLAALYLRLRDVKDEIAAKESQLNVDLAAVEQLMWSAFEDAGLTSVKLSDGSSIRVQQEPFVTVLDRAAVRQWAEGNGLGESLQVPWMTLNSATKERLLAGLPAPDGVEVSVRTTTFLARGARG